jgi:hypothetical protein
MSLRSKVAAALAITLLALPAVALASCSLHRSVIAKNTAACQMMNKHLVLASVQNAFSGAGCCELSSGEPVPISLVQARGSSADGIAPTSSVSIIDIPSIVVGTAPRMLPIRPSGPALQATLCVFLI